MKQFEFKKLQQQYKSESGNHLHPIKIIGLSDEVEKLLHYAKIAPYKIKTVSSFFGKENKYFSPIWLALKAEDRDTLEALIREYNAQNENECWYFPFELSDFNQDMFWYRGDLIVDSDESVIDIRLGELSIYIDIKKSMIHVPDTWMLDTKTKLNITHNLAAIVFLRWIVALFKSEYKKLAQDKKAYYKRLNIPSNFRYATIQATAYSLVTQKEACDDLPLVPLLDELSDDEKKQLLSLSNKSPVAPIKRSPINLAIYLAWIKEVLVELGRTNKDLSPHECYLRCADGRHGGLLDISADSESEFRKWLELPSFGAHPWEIIPSFCSSNSVLIVPHVNDYNFLSVHTTDASQNLDLAVRATLKLTNLGVPTCLENLQRYAKLAKGECLIGVTPQGNYWDATEKFQLLSSNHPEVIFSICREQAEEHVGLLSAMKSFEVDAIFIE